MRTLGIVISTRGRQSLAHTLASILYQREGVEDVLVVGDGFDQATKELVEFYSRLGLSSRYEATVKTRDRGHSQVNHGLRHVKGDYVTYQSDDNIYLPRAIEEMLRLVNDFREPQVLIGRVKTPTLGLLWQRPDVTSVLDGHCLVVPNDKRKLGWLSSAHNGDQSFLHTTLRNYEQWAWTDRIWMSVRPSWPMEVLECRRIEGQWEWLFLDPLELDVVARLLMHKDPDNDRMFARISWCGQGSLTGRALSRDEYIQIVQFALYACQGNDCWFQFDNPNDATLISALVESNYKEHTPTEYTHDWPADFWPSVPEFDHVINPETGERLDDYRDDVWGGRAV